MSSDNNIKSSDKNRAESIAMAVKILQEKSEHSDQWSKEVLQNSSFKKQDDLKDIMDMSFEVLSKQLKEEL